MKIDVNDETKYASEYGVRVRRITEFLQQHSANTLHNLSGALADIAPGESVAQHVNKPNVEEFFLVLEGSLEFTLDTESSILRQGDIGFASIGQSHSFTNVTAEPARMLSVWWTAGEGV